MRYDVSFNMAGSKEVVCVQGLGFVGFAMATAISSARDSAGHPRFDVIGVDLPTPEGRAKVDAINAGRLPVACSDEELAAAFSQAFCHFNPQFRSSYESCRVIEKRQAVVKNVSFMADGPQRLPE